MNNFQDCNCESGLGPYCTTCYPELTPEEKRQLRLIQIKDDFMRGYDYKLETLCYSPTLKSNTKVRFLSHIECLVLDTGEILGYNDFLDKGYNLNPTLDSLFKWVYGPEIKKLVQTDGLGGLYEELYKKKKA